MRFGATLLDGLLARQQVRLSALGRDLIPVLDKTRTRLRQDAVRAGWLRRFRQEQRTPRGEQLLKEIHSVVRPRDHSHGSHGHGGYDSGYGAYGSHSGGFGSGHGGH
jgi:hypothetical protein